MDRFRGSGQHRVRLTVYPSWAETYEAIAKEEGFLIGDVAEAASQVRGFTGEIDTAHGG